MNCEIGVVIPVYNAARSIGTVTESLLTYFASAGIAGRVLLVDDGSADESGAVIERLAAVHKCVMAVRLARNCGQQSALLCGLTLAGNCRFVATMDDDLQHPARVLAALYAKIQEGYDLVYAIPQGEPRPLYRRAGSLLRDGVFAVCTKKPRGMRVSSYRIMTAALTERICAERQAFVYLSASAFRYAPKTANIPYCPSPRAYGTSGYTLGKLAGIYGNLLLYYALPAAFRPRTTRASYEITSIVEGGSRIEQTDDIGRLQLPEKRADSRQKAWA